MQQTLNRPVRNRYLFVSDIILLAAAAYGSYVLRLETLDLAGYWPGFLLFTGLALVILPLVFLRAGIYARYWRYASVEELVLLAGSVTIGVLLIGAVGLLTVRLLPGGWSDSGSVTLSSLLQRALAPQGLTTWTLPRSIPLIFMLLALVATAGPRFALRLSARSTLRQRANGRGSMAQPTAVLIMGAGDAGAMIVRELRSNPHLGLEPVGFLDDDLGKHKVTIHGVPVLGDRHAIPELATKYKVKQVIIAMPTARGKEMRDIVQICGEAGVEARTIPGIFELLDGTVSVNQLRAVKIEDLLRREPVQTDTVQVEALLKGKRVLITGAGGSIGSEICRQVLRCEPAGLVLLGHGENSIFDIHNELQDEASRLQVLDACEQPAHCRLHPVIADIRFPDRLAAVFATHRPEIVFHAAAHKHVPLMEDNVEDAITNNVLGTHNVVEASIAAGVSHFVLISTDKAVNPTSVMGATKRVAELIVQEAAQRTGCAYVAVRFGNVLGSRGSVVPYFQRQIAAGGPVTVTHPDIKRYFMTIPEAVQLVLQAGAMGRRGEIFVLDMGEPVRIADLARDLIRISHLEPDLDIEIRYTGLRPGEKLFEELFRADEKYARTQHHKVFAYQNGNQQNVTDTEQFGAALARLVAAVGRETPEELRVRLLALVPDYNAEHGQPAQVWDS